MLLQINNPARNKTSYLEIVTTLFISGVIVLTGLPVILQAYQMSGI